MANLNTKRREKVLAILTSIVVFALVWTYLVLRPIFTYRDQLEIDLATKNLKLREARKILTGTPQTTRESLARFVSEGSGQEDMARMIKDIEAAAGTAGLRVLETKPQPPVKNVGWFEMKVIINFEGSWSDIVRFFYQLESVSRPLLVNEMSLEANLPQQTLIRGRLEIGRLLAAPAVEF